MRLRGITRFAGTALALILLCIPYGASVAFAAYTHPLAPTLSISQVFVTDASNNAKQSFRSGDGINYHIIGNNTSGSTLTISINFWADTRDKTSQHIMLDKTFSLDLPAGGFHEYTMSSIPAGTVSGRYTFTGMVYQNSDRNNNAMLESNPFAVTSVSVYPLNLPYYSQFSGGSTHNNECGETSVAMVVSYYIDINPYTQKPEDLIERVRNTIGVSAQDDTNITQLKDALWKIDEKQIVADATKLPNTLSVDDAVQIITTQTRNGNPVIAFVDGRALGRQYSGHWIVIRGIIADTVYINDPDDSRTGTKVTDPNNPGQTTLSLSQYKKAAYDGAIGQGQPYGLVVTGEDFHTP